ncbi:CpXC domain-containing protein [Fundicoccus culcitae]|uniref:CpXC domain-containing protein n=1 Tax=Fundicoccus culcitae TaxID=2969821 RepID=A0ABY5P262_9LACT|nr:CpXC domain-containing protein [Fundicoccus culcitae]UUX32799.1 CpXC domain-containing protein [Fundicoccus culcitae]
MTQTVNLTCPVCNHQSTRQVNAAINAKTHPHLKQELLEGKTFLYECEQCGAQRVINFQMLYHDPDQRLLIYLAPGYVNNKEQTLEILDDLKNRQPVSLDNYHLRIVLSGAELLEKIQIFDQHFNDYEVELVKLLTDGIFSKEKSGETVKARYFYMDPKSKSAKIMYTTDSQQLLVDFHQSLLDFVKNKFKKELQQPQRGEFQLVNYTWAIETVSKDTKKDQ